MPSLDVSFILNGADIADTFHVRRRQETIGTNGRVSLNETRYNNVIGVVTIGSPNDLDRGEDKQYFTRSLSIVTKFSLRGETDGYQPDVVEWRGSNYVVKHIDPYPHFGAGFYQVECESMDKVDPAVDDFTSFGSSLVFTLTSNSNNIPLVN